MNRNTKDAIENILKQKEKALKTLEESRHNKREQQKKINDLKTQKDRSETAYKSQNIFKRLWNYRKHQKERKDYNYQIQFIEYNIKNYIDPVIDGCKDSISRSDEYVKHLKNPKTKNNNRARKPEMMPKRQQQQRQRDNSLQM